MGRSAHLAEHDGTLVPELIHLSQALFRLLQIIKGRALEIQHRLEANLLDWRIGCKISDKNAERLWIGQKAVLGI